MSDVPVGATPRPYPSAGLADDDSSKAQQVASQGKEAAGQAASEVKDTAKEQAQRVGSEAKTQARNVASDVRNRVSDQAHSQNDKLVTGIRQAADQLDDMRGDRQDSPAATIVSRVADSGRQFADYLDRNGPEGVLREVQDFARRRPGAFLASALAAGFVVGRLGKGVAKADSNAGKPATDSFVSSTPDTGYTTGYTGTTTGYPDTTTGTTTGLTGATTTGGAYDTGSTGYAEPVVDNPTYTQGAPVSTEYASTGTGTPVVVDEEYVLENPSESRTDYPGGTR